MDEIDAQIAAIQAELQSLRAMPTPTEPAAYSVGQAGFDIPAALATAGAGTIDVLSLPFTGLARALGADPETTRYFALTKELQKAKEEAAAQFGVRPDTMPQEILSFVSPSPLSKAKLLSQAGTGLASYLGMKGAETIAPESPYAGLVGALIAPLGATKLTTKAAGAIAPKLEEAGLGLQRRALGITKADYKNAKNAVIETVDGEFSTQLKTSVDNLIKNKTLGTSRDPGDMYANLQAAKESTEDAIQSVLKSTEAQVGPVPPPTFNNTIDYIKNNIDSADVDSYLAYLANKQSSLIREGQGSLTYLNQQKKVVGENWKNSPLSDAGFWRTLYRDMKEHIEKYAPEIKDLNKKKQDLVVVEPIVTRNFKVSGGDFDIGAAQRLLNTTGGAGLAGGAIIGAATGNLGRGLLGALGLRALSTPTGQNIVGRGLRGTASLAEALAGAKLDVGGALGRTGIAAGPEAEAPTQNIAAEVSAESDIDQQINLLQNELNQIRSQPSATPTPTIRIGKQDVSLPMGDKYAPEDLMRAVVQTESGAKANAVSKKGARGPAQLMPATAKELGVDIDDPTQNIEGGSRYLKRLLNQFNDRKLALAAYNWGPGSVRRALNRLEKRKIAPTYENMLRYVSVPDETESYVSKVLNQLT
jgi:hypothetical protein